MEKTLGKLFHLILVVLTTWLEIKISKIFA